jgi:hypothetical protein
MLSECFHNGCHYIYVRASLTQQLIIVVDWLVTLHHLRQCSHQHGKRRQGQARWITSTASRYFQGRVIETNGLDTLAGILSPVPHRSKGDRAETRGTQPFQGSAVSWSLRKRAFSNTGTSHCLTTFSRGSFVFHRAGPIQITWLGSLLQVQRVKWKVCESERHYCSVQETLRF